MPCVAISAKDLRHKVTILRPALTRDAAGQEVEGATPTTVLQAWAEVLDAGGGETIRGRQVAATATHLVRLRYTSTAIGSTDYLLWGTRRLNIVHAADPDGRRVVLELHCKEER